MPGGYLISEEEYHTDVIPILPEGATLVGRVISNTLSSTSLVYQVISTQLPITVTLRSTSNDRK